MSSPLPQNPHALALESKAAMDRKDWGTADLLLRQRLAVTPQDPGLLFDLGLVAYRRNALNDAEGFLRKAADLGAGEPAWLLLGRIFVGLRRDTDAIRAYKSVVKSNPAQFEALLALGDIRHRNGDRSGARANYRQAVEARPTDPDAVIKYSGAVWDDGDPETAVAMTLDLLARTSDLAARARVLQSALWQVECWERITHGQTPYHAAHSDELFFTYAAPLLADFERAYAALATANPADSGAKIGLGLAHFCRGDRTGAEALFQAAGPAIAGGALETARFSPAFHAALRLPTDANAGEEFGSGLPTVTTVRPLVPDPAGVLFLSCDSVYIAGFGLPLLCSLQASSPATPVHLHIIDPAAQDLQRIAEFCDALGLRFALTSEAPELHAAPVQVARSYFHAVRFIRFHQFLGPYGCPLWMTDVDALVNRDLRPLFGHLHGRDAAMRLRPGRLEPQNQFSACAVGAAQTPASQAYFRQLAAYIAHFHRQGALRWGIDQVAMYAVFADMQDRNQAPGLALLDQRHVDFDQLDDGVIWMTAGARKFQHLQGAMQPGTVPPPEAAEARYVAAFEKHRKAAQIIAAGIGWKI